MVHSEPSEALFGLVKSVHDHVLQSLIGVSLVLAGSPSLPEPTRLRAADELAEAIARLRALMSDATQQIECMPQAARESEGELARLVRSVLGEALRNAQKHAGATAVSIDVRADASGLVLDVVNDVAEHRAGNGGIGLRLAAVEALRAGGLLEAGPTANGRWNLCLSVPA